MEFARYTRNLAALVAEMGEGVAPLGESLAAQLQRQLLDDVDIPREALARALAERQRQFESLLSCVAGTFFRRSLHAPYAIELFGRDISEVLGFKVETSSRWTLANVLLPEDFERLRRLTQQALANNGHFELVARVNHPAGEERWVNIHVRSVFGEDGLPRWVEGLITDITAARREEIALQARANDLRATLDSIPHMVWWHQMSDGQLYLNRRWHDFTGLAPDPSGARASNIDRMLHPDEAAAVRARWREGLRQGTPFDFQFRLRHSSGEYRWLHASGRPDVDSTGKILRWYGTCDEIDDQRRAERELRELRAIQDNILDASADCIKVLGTDGQLMDINTTGLRLLEIDSREQILGKAWPDIWPHEGRLAARRAVRTAAAGRRARFAGFAPTLKGTPRWWENTLTPVRDDDGAICRILCVSRDITGERAAAERLRIASQTDALTRLPNRSQFEMALKRAIAHAREDAADGHVGLMLIDLDHFKHVNDTLGHLAGDRLLRVIGRRLRDVLAGKGFVARLGGDEFAVVLPALHGEEEMRTIALQMQARMEEPVTYNGQPINGGMSVGCALYPRDGADARELFKNADTALYDLKASGRGGVQTFSKRMMRSAQRTANQLTLARTAIQDNAIQPYYQPKVRLDTGEVSGLEALLRWHRPGHGVQTPGQLAEAFNDYELAARIGAVMQSRALADIAGWMRAGLDPVPVSINASPVEFLRDDYAERLLQRLREHEVPARLIEIEVTEHGLVERGSAHVARALWMLKRAGIRIALDDFGTGHSSLSHLREFTVDFLKVDRSFVSRITTDPEMRAIVQAIAKLGPSLDIAIVAEGVETEQQLEELRAAGCAYGQGYLFGRAMEAAEVTRRLRTNHWPHHSMRATHG